MNEPMAICTIGIIILTSLFSLVGFHDPAFRERYLFSVQEILAGKQYHRVLTSALLHADWNHLLLNMISLFLFGRPIEQFLGAGQFMLIYVAAIVGGGVLSLWLHRHHEYRAYGASGGVCGMIFGYIVLFPGSGIFVFPVPVAIPAWLYAILFLLGSFLALRRQADNIGHDAHLGGAIIGLWTMAALQPGLVGQQPGLFATISALSALLFVYLLKNPLFLPLSSFLPDRSQPEARPGSASSARREARELDAILEKISRSGLDSLSPEEKELLNSVSAKYQRRADSEKPKSGLTI